MKTNKFNNNFFKNNDELKDFIFKQINTYLSSNHLTLLKCAILSKCLSCCFYFFFEKNEKQNILIQQKLLNLFEFLWKKEFSPLGFLYFLILLIFLFL